MHSFTPERYKKRRKFYSRLRLYFLMIVFVFLFGGIFYFVFLSSFTTSFAFIINGSEFIQEHDFEDLSPRMLTIKLPQNLLLLNSGEAESYLLESYPQLASVVITKNLFDHELIVDTKERQKEFVWCAQVKCYWADSSGVVFSEAPNVKGQLIIKVNDKTQKSFDYGEKVLLDEDLANLNTFITALKNKGYTRNSVEYISDIEKEFIIYLQGGAKIYMSLHNASDELYNAFFDVLDSLNLLNIDYIDITVENRIYYKQR